MDFLFESSAACQCLYLAKLQHITSVFPRIPLATEAIFSPSQNRVSGFYSRACHRRTLICTSACHVHGSFSTRCSPSSEARGKDTFRSNTRQEHLHSLVVPLAGRTLSDSPLVCQYTQYITYTLHTMYIHCLSLSLSRSLLPTIGYSKAHE